MNNKGFDLYIIVKFLTMEAGERITEKNQNYQNIPRAKIANDCEP